jgi:hypothetical protein
MTTRTYTAFLPKLKNNFPLKNNAKKKQLKVIYYDSAAHDQNQTGAGIWCKRTTSSQNKDPGATRNSGKAVSR